MSEKNLLEKDIQAHLKKIESDNQMVASKEPQKKTWQTILLFVILFSTIISVIISIMNIVLPMSK